MNQISDRAVVSPKAKIGENVKIFPFVYIEDYVEIGDNCTIFPCVSILNGTKMGKNNKVHQGTVIGALPQDFDFRGERSLVEIGDDNVIRENVIINRATHEGCKTVIGNGNFLMESVHISHDTKIDPSCFSHFSSLVLPVLNGQQGWLYHNYAHEPLSHVLSVQPLPSLTYAVRSADSAFSPVSALPQRARGWHAHEED